MAALLSPAPLALTHSRRPGVASEALSGVSSHLAGRLRASGLFGRIAVEPALGFFNPLARRAAREERVDARAHPFRPSVLTVRGNRAMPNNLSAQDVRHLFSYDWQIGGLFWKNRTHPNSRALIGQRIGAEKPDHRTTYRFAGVRGRYYYEHRLVWLWHHGVNPPELIDHINGDGQDNRIENLRLATYLENARNCRKRAGSSNPYKGTFWRPDQNAWVAYIHLNGKRLFLGRFDTAEQARAAYLFKARELFGEFMRAA